MMRIAVYGALDWDCYAREVFDSHEDADRYWNSLFADDSVLESISDRACVVVKEEMHRGTWVEVCRKLVDLR